MDHHDTAPAEPGGGGHEHFSLAVLGIADGPLHFIHEPGWKTWRQTARAECGRRRGEQHRMMDP